MTKKHFKAIAAAVAQARDEAEPAPGEYGDPVAAIDTLAHALADVCRQTNPNFDRARFLSACGVE